MVGTVQNLNNMHELKEVKLRKKIGDIILKYKVNGTLPNIPQEFNDNLCIIKNEKIPFIVGELSDLICEETHDK